MDYAPHATDDIVEISDYAETINEFFAPPVVLDETDDPDCPEESED